VVHVLLQIKNDKYVLELGEKKVFELQETGRRK
jgi:hypothetical protein